MQDTMNPCNYDGWLSLAGFHGTADPLNYTELHVTQLNAPHIIGLFLEEGIVGFKVPFFDF